METPFKPLALSTSRGTSSTFPLTQTSTRSQSQQASDLQSGSDDLSRFASQESRQADRTPRRSRRDASDDRQISPKGGARDRTHPSLSPQQLGRSAFDGKPHRHKHSRSRDLRFPNAMSHLASSASARGLLPTWSGGKDKDREDDGLLRPFTRETTSGRWGSESTTGLTDGRNGSLLDTPEQYERLGPIRRHDIMSMDDLEKVRKRRKLGEEYLRSALASIGTLATDVTRRLDYTYYNLLEKVTAVNSTISSFQELSDSASTLLNDFERETAGLDQDIRKQLDDLKGFESQIQRADVLQQRMKAGRQRVEELGKRLESVRHEIDSWEQRETEWQTRTSRRLRIFWGIVASTLLVLLFALVIQNWPQLRSSHAGMSGLTASNISSTSVPPQSERDKALSLGREGSRSAAGPPRYPSNLADRRESLAKVGPTSTAGRSGHDTSPAEHNFLRVLDEL